MTAVHLVALMAVILFIWVIVFPRLSRGDNTTAAHVSVIRGRAGFQRLRIVLGTAVYDYLIPIARAISWFAVGSMIVTIGLVRYFDPSNLGQSYLDEVQAGEHTAFVAVCIVTVVATIVTAWNDRRSHANFSLQIAFTIGFVALFVLGDILMWVDRPHYGRWEINVLGATLCVVSLFYLECLGRVIVAFVKRLADALDEGVLVNLLDLIQELVGEFVPALGRIFTSGKTGAVDQEAWKVAYDRFWASMWLSFAPFPLIAILNEGVIVPFAAFIYAIWFGWTCFILDQGKISTVERRKWAVLSLLPFTGLLLIDFIAQYAVPDYLSIKMRIWNALTGQTVPAAGDTAVEWIVVCVQVLATTIVLVTILVCLALLSKSVREHAWFKKASLGLLLSFVVIMFYMLAPSTVSRLSAPTAAQVFPNTPGVLVSWSTSYRGDGVVIQVRDQRGGKFKSVGWVEKRATSWRHFPKAWGNLAYVACFVPHGPQCAEDICRPEEIPPLPAGVLCYEETLMDVPASSAVASN